MLQFDQHRRAADTSGHCGLALFMRLRPSCRDPDTGLPYATAEAYKELRSKAGDAHFLQSKRTKRRRIGGNATFTILPCLC